MDNLSVRDVYKAKLDQMRQYYLTHPKLSVFAKKLISLARPAISFRYPFSEEGSVTTNEVGISHYGGLPDLPEGYPYPEDKGVPLIFLAQLRLEEIAPVDITGLLPKKGLLQFYIPGERGAEIGKTLFFEHCSDFKQPRGIQPTYKVYPIRDFEIIVSLPEQFSIAIESVLGYNQDNYMETADPYWNSKFEWNMGDILGYPNSVQSAVLDDAVRKQHGKLPVDAHLKASEEWVRLFQSGVPQEGDDRGMIWDYEWLFFYTINKNDLLQCKFEQVDFHMEYGD